MKGLFFSMTLLLSALSVCGQNDYFVKTKGAKVVTRADGVKADRGVTAEEPQDFIAQNFRFYSLCDWKPGMKFMVMPEKYDLIVNTFCNASTGREVSNGKLRHHIMVYKGHTETDDGHANINFRCPDDGNDYYYQVPSGSFENYCGGKMGVPTLAYLGDVDVAREKLKGATLFTNGTVYYEDTELNGDGCEEVSVPKGTEVKVVAVGVGTRRFPVKLIVADSKGREFFQNVAISRTNSGMREDEFGGGNVHHTFKGAFELADEVGALAGEYAPYVNKTVYTKYRTTMQNASGDEVNIIRLSGFRIVQVRPKAGSKRVTMTLKSTKTGELYTKDVAIANESVIGDIDGQREDYYAFLFGEGDVWKRYNVSAAHRELIRQGRVAKGFTAAEVQLAKGKPRRKVKSGSGRMDWIYGNGQIVKFNKARQVIAVASF